MSTAAHGIHQLSTAQLDLLACAPSDPALVGELRRARISRTAMFVAWLARREPGLRAAVDLISEAQEAAPDEVAALFAYPWVGVWAADAARKTLGDLERAYFEGVALAAAVRAGLVGLEEAAGRAQILPGAGGAGHDGAGWSPVRRISIGYGQRTLTVAVDDVDPYRHCHRLPATDRLTGAELDRWHALVGDAWTLLATAAPAWADEIGAGLRSLVPLRAGPSGLSHSATHHEAFGGLAASYQPDPAEFAATLVHEFQHSKLNVAMHLVPLHDAKHERRYFAPWRTEPRPIAGLLHGVYAFTAVAALWNELRRFGVAGAEERFALVRAQVDRALQGLDGLTGAGRRLVGGVRSEVDRLLEVPVSPAVAARAERTVGTAERQWRRWYGE